jgi:hypothetical protein
MTIEMSSVAQITTRALAILSRELGPVNTARFINQFSVGSGDYTEERDSIIGSPTVAEIVAEIKNQRNPGSDQNQDCHQ